MPHTIPPARQLARDASQMADDGEEFLHPDKTKCWFFNGAYYEIRRPVKYFLGRRAGFGTASESPFVATCRRA